MGLVLTLVAVAAIATSPAAAAAQAPPAPTTGTIAVGPDGNVWFTEPEAERIARITPAGGVTEFAARGRFQHPTWITTGPDGNLWFPSGWQGQEIGRITPRGAVQTFSDGLYPHGTCCGETEVQLGPMVPGADGNLWFTQINGVGRITPAGSIRLFDRRFPATHPFAIAAGPDGNMWFLEDAPSDGRGASPLGAVGRITPAGAVTRFTAGITSRVGPWTWNREAIVLGPDRNMWFAEARGVGRITPAGLVTEFPTGGPPAALVAGPDGNVWFATGDGRFVGRIGPDGALSAFATGIGSGRPWSPQMLGTPKELEPHVGLAAGPDGNVWFSVRKRIGRVTPDGVVTEFRAGLSRGAEPQDLVAGPDGNVWFVEAGPTRVGRITPAGAITEFSPIAAVAAVRQLGTRAVRVRLSCPAGAVRACRGTLQLEGRGGHATPRHRFTVAPAGRTSVVLPLTPAWRRAVVARGRLDLGLKLLPRGWTPSAFVWRRVTLRRGSVHETGPPSRPRSLDRPPRPRIRGDHGRAVPS